MLTVGQRILFAGKTWFVEQIDEAQKTIYVIRTSGGVPPLFSGSTGRIHTRVRQCMRCLLESNDVPLFLDEVARRFLAEARQGYADRNLGSTFFIDQGKVLYILTWLGDAANEAIACLLIRRGFIATAAGPGVEVQKGLHTTEEILDALIDTAIEDPPPLNVLLADVKNLQREKWDWALPDDLLRIAYASLYLNLDEALKWTKKIASMGSS
jgi:ATP-dependent Lhr-like helicase